LAAGIAELTTRDAAQLWHPAGTRCTNATRPGGGRTLAFPGCQTYDGCMPGFR